MNDSQKNEIIDQLAHINYASADPSTWGEVNDLIKRARRLLQAPDYDDPGDSQLTVSLSRL